MKLSRLIVAAGIIIIWSSTGMLFTAGPIYGEEKMMCEDGESFEIKESGVIESVLPPIGAEKIVINSRTFRLTYYRNGKPEKSYPVAIGAPKTPSPIGEWRVIHKGGTWGGGFGARWLGLNVPWGIYGIHGTNKPGSIGSRASHGCIRMFNRHVVELYSIVKVGTPVYILGELPKVPLRRELGRKTTGKDVLLLQFALRKAGFDPGMADARYGSGTELAVCRLQDFYGLAVTGKASINEQYLLGLR